MKKYLAIIATLTFVVYLSQTVKHTIYIYNDKGVSNESVTHTKDFFSATSYNVKYLDAKDLLKGTWTQDAALFVMPGGADRLYVTKLQGKGDEIIQKYVKEGGSFLGICAGSYYASGFVEFDKGGPDEVVGKRDLKLINSYAIGPVLARYSYNSNKGARAAALVCKTNKLNIFYNGGPYFKIPASNTTAEVICTYSEKDNLPAIVYSKYGKGKVLLSAVHFEYDPTKLNHADPDYHSIIDTLSDDNEHRIAFAHELLEKLGLKG